MTHPIASTPADPREPPLPSDPSIEVTRTFVEPPRRPREAAPSDEGADRDDLEDEKTADDDD